VSDAETDSRPIADVEEGSTVTVTGEVRLGQALTSPLGGKRCAYYAVHEHLLDEGQLGTPQEHAARDFVIEDASGRALVVMENHQVTIGAERRKQAVEALDADIHELSARLRELKDQLRAGGGPNHKALHAELMQKKRLATLLCTVRAHARGKLHAQRDLAEQEEYIVSESARYQQGEGVTRAASVLVDRYEATIEEGLRVWVTGVAGWEPDPDVVRGYREQARRLVLRAPEGKALLVRTESVQTAVLPNVRNVRRRDARAAKLNKLKPIGLRGAITFMAALTLVLGVIGALLRAC
jgi:hypothetical protein